MNVLSQFRGLLVVFMCQLLALGSAFAWTMFFGYGDIIREAVQAFAIFTATLAFGQYLLRPEPAKNRKKDLVEILSFCAVALALIRYKPEFSLGALIMASYFSSRIQAKLAVHSKDTTTGELLLTSVVATIMICILNVHFLHANGFVLFVSTSLYGYGVFSMAKAMRDRLLIDERIAKLDSEHEAIMADFDARSTARLEELRRALAEIRQQRQNGQSGENPPPTPDTPTGTNFMDVYATMMSLGFLFMSGLPIFATLFSWTGAVLIGTIVVIQAMIENDLSISQK